MQNILHNVRTFFTPVLASSQFLEKGVLTPEEFVTAGDQLVFRCSTWVWQAGDPKNTKPYLPPDKQYLITRSVPCLRRARTLELLEEKDTGDNGWVETNSTGQKPMEMDIPEITQENSTPPPAAAPANTAANPANAADSDLVTDMALDDDDIPDMDSFVEENLIEIDSATVAIGKMSFDANAAPDDNILKTRTYDLHITYDKYYQTPRVWLFGYSESGQPLTPHQIFEDISQDHAHKTVTIEPHPHIGIPYASIHPCRHAEVMKRIVDRTRSAGREPRVDQYLFIFLKFISAVIPTIEYDYTLEMQF